MTVGGRSGERIDGIGVKWNREAWAESVDREDGNGGNDTLASSGMDFVGDRFGGLDGGLCVEWFVYHSGLRV